MRTNLFGEPDTAGQHKHLVRLWCRQWRDQYGEKYPFLGKDARCIQIIQRQTGDPEAVIRAYLSAGGSYFKGHPLSKLCQNLPRFVADSHRSGDFYGGATSAAPLPVL